MSSCFWLQAGLRNQRRRCSGLLALKNCVSHWASNFPLCCSLKKEKRLLSAPMKKGNIPKLKWKISFTYHARLCTDQTANINNIIIFRSPNYPALPLIPGNLEVKISSSFFHEIVLGSKVFFHKTLPCLLVKLRDSCWKINGTQGTNFKVARRAGNLKTVSPYYMMQISDFTPSQKLQRTSALHFLWPELHSTGGLVPCLALLYTILLSVYTKCT